MHGDSALFKLCSPWCIFLYVVAQDWIAQNHADVTENIGQNQYMVWASSSVVSIFTPVLFDPSSHLSAVLHMTVR